MDKQKEKGHSKTFTYKWLYSSHPFLSYLGLYSIFSCLHKARQGKSHNSLLGNIRRWRSTQGIFHPHPTYNPTSTKNFLGITAKSTLGTRRSSRCAHLQYLCWERASLHALPRHCGQPNK